MRFSSELDSFVKILVEERLNMELVEKDIIEDYGEDCDIYTIDYAKYDYNRINLNDNHVVIAEHRTRREYNLEENDRYGLWLKEGVVSHVKVLDSGTIYTVSYDYVATSKSDDIENLKIEVIADEEEMLEALREQYAEFDKEATEIYIDDIRAKVIKRKFEKCTKETSITLNF